MRVQVGEADDLAPSVDHLVVVVICRMVHAEAYAHGSAEYQPETHEVSGIVAA